MVTSLFEVLDSFSLVWVPTFKVCVLTSGFKFWIGSKWILVIDILNQILLTLLIFIALQILRRYQFVVQGFFWCVLLCKRPIYAWKSDRWITLWWAKFELECLLKYWFSLIQNSWSLTKMRTLNDGVSKLISKKK